MSRHYDLVVLGSGPAGQRAAVQAAKLGKKVCVIEAVPVVGGVCTNTGTIPSKTFRQAVMHLTGFHEKGIYGAAYQVKHHITIGDLLFRVDHVVRSEIDVIRSQLARNGIDMVEGAGRFTGPSEIRVDGGAEGDARLVSGDRIVIATGTVATRDPHIPFDGEHTIVSDDILCLKRLPRTLAVIGAGVIGVEYATMFAALGVKVTLIDKRDRLLPFVDREITDSLAYHLQQNRVMLRLGEEVGSVVVTGRTDRPPVEVQLKSGKSVPCETALYTIGRTGATAGLDLAMAGIEADARGRIPVDANFQTRVPHIYAVGDVVGFPALASTAMEQGRQAARHAFGLGNGAPSLDPFPYGIYTVPEISMVGATEDELTDKAVPYEVGKARFRELARGQITGDTIGLLKLLFCPDSRRLLGVHVIGEGASEIVHIGQALMAHNGTVDWLADSVFNYPTMAEAYKVAALDGLNRLSGY